MKNKEQSFKDKVEKYSAFQSDRIIITDKYIKFLNEKGRCHRENGPAVEWSNGTRLWYIDGRYHREDGPAVEFSNGSKSWYLNGVKYWEEEFNKEITTKRTIK